MSTLSSIVLLSDVDAMIREANNPGSRGRLDRLGFELEGLARVTAQRGRLAESIERRWTVAYERVRQRYARAVASVRERVCAGCFVTLPITARPREGSPEVLQICESCGRLLYWI